MIFFESKLKTINENVTEITEIEEETAIQIKEEALQEFNPKKVYIFSLLNSVVFSNDILDELAILAENYTDEEEKESIETKDLKNSKEIIQRYENEIQRIKNRYEKKLSGMQKKIRIRYKNIEKTDQHFAQKT